MEKYSMIDCLISDFDKPVKTSLCLSLLPVFCSRSDVEVRLLEFRMYRMLRPMVRPELQHLQSYVHVPSFSGSFVIFAISYPSRRGRICVFQKKTQKATCATRRLFLFGARHYEKPSTGYGDLEHILLAGTYVACAVIHM